MCALFEWIRIYAHVKHAYVSLIQTQRGLTELKPFYPKWQHVITAVILGFEKL